MVWPIRSKTSSLLRSTLALVAPSLHGDHTSRCSNFAKWAKTEAVLPFSVKEKQVEIPRQETDSSKHLFGTMKQRFLNFKKHKYMKELENFQALAQAQSPKFMVIACADSRVCPSNILGFQPGEAFVIRNIANLVPPIKNGPTECNAALEFAATILKVENILVIGHSCCAGIETLMNIQEDAESSFINKWVMNGRVSKWRTKAATDSANLSFGEQCKFCEKESINQSLMNLLTYPWIEDKVRNELLFLHGGYYDFSNCSFEKWTLDFKACHVKQGGNYRVKERDFWC